LRAKRGNLSQELQTMSTKTNPPSTQAEKWLADFIGWLQNIRRYSPHTSAAYGRDLAALFLALQNHIGEPLSTTNWQTLTAADIHAALSPRLTRHHHAKTSLNRQLSSLRTFTKWLAATHNITNDKLLHLKGLKTPAPVPKALNPTQAWQLLETLAPPATGPQKLPLHHRRNFALIITLYGLGLRISEALALTRQQAQADTLTITGKGNKQRTVPLPLPVKSALNQWLTGTQFLPPEAPLFPNTLNPDNPHPKPLTARQAQLILKATREKLGLPAHATPHALRHSFATHMLHNGTDLRTVQELLGHANLGTTQRYLAADIQHLLATHKKAHPLG
jgi:integrase/recombinase XerC